MRRIFHGFLRAIGQGFAPISRPLARWLDERVERLLDARLAAELDARLVPTLTAALAATAQTVSRLDALIAQTDRSTHETDEALNTLLDEVNRLREQVENLQQFLLPPEAEGDSSNHAGLAIADHDEVCEPFEDVENEAVGERAKVG